jgi:hypothetical protein
MMSNVDQPTDRPPHRKHERTVDRHPLRAMLTVEQWVQMRSDVEFGRITWPIGFEVVRVELSCHQESPG